MIPAINFKRGKTRIRFLIPFESGTKMNVKVNSKSNTEKVVYVWPVWVYDNPQKGEEGQIKLIIESYRSKKFLETLAMFFRNYKEEIQQDLIVERIKEQRKIEPDWFAMHVAEIFEEDLPYDQSVVDELQGEFLKETVYVALKEREERHVEFLESHNFPVHYDRIDVTFS